MRIALFGGSFDPPHVGHQMACLYVLLTHDVDEVWMVPCYRHPFDKRTVPFAHRVELCKLAAQDLGPRVRVCTIEEELGDKSYTLVTVQALKARHPEHTFSVVIGADLIKERERWHRFADLAQLAPFVIIGRAGHAGTGVPTSGSPATPGAVQPDDRQHAEPLALPAVSSTEVRAQLAQGQLPRGWVARAVLEYIQQHHLYVAEKS